MSSESLVYLTVGAAAIGFVFWRLQFSTDAICCGDLDGYYHIGWSQRLWQSIRTGHFPPAFTWLPLTTLNPRDYVDHHLLFHLLQIPFTWLGDARFGAKVSAALFASLAVFSCYWLLVRSRISYALLWLVALLGCSAPFLFRMNMSKAMGVSIVMMILGIHLLFERRDVWLLPLAFVFTLTYDMFVLLGIAAAIWTAIVWWSERRVEWRPLLWIAVGVVAGFVVNPYFPHNIGLFYEHLLIKVTAKDFSTNVGQEWYPYSTLDFMGNSLIACVAMIVGYVAFDWRDKERARRPLFFLVFSTLLLIANFRWRRFAEYWPPFAVLFAAFSLQAVLDGVRSSIGQLPAGVLDDLQPYLDQQEHPEVAAQRRQRRWLEVETLIPGFILAASFFVIATGSGLKTPVKAALIAGGYVLLAAVYFKLRGGKATTMATIALLLFLALFFNVRAEIKEIGSTAPHDEYRKGIEWMRNNVPPGEVIFNTDWDDFPKLFFYDPTHAYISGLDPTYLLDQHKDLSELYDRITLGKENDPGPLIRDRFGAHYVFSDTAEVHDDFYNGALDSGWFDEVYADDHCTVLHIRDEKGAPPPDNVDNAPNGDNQDQPDSGNDEDDTEDNEQP